MGLNEMGGEKLELELEEKEEAVEYNNIPSHHRSFNNDVVFPPVNHEGLPHSPPIIPPPPDVIHGYDVATRWVCQLRSNFVPRVLWLFRGFCANHSFSHGAGVAVTAGFFVWWFYYKVVMSRRRTRDRLDLVIKEKDEKIKQLLHQIAQMNQLLLSLHKGSLSHGGSAT